MEFKRPAALAADPLAILQHRHHAEPEKIDLHQPEVLAIVLVPLHDAAVGHGGGLHGHDAVEAARAQDHPARMLAEVPGQRGQLLAQ